MGRTAGLLRVGFDRSFGVKLQGYGLLKGACRELSRSSKRFKWLTKISEKDKSTEGDVDHIERSGVHLRLQIRLRPAQVASGVWVFVALVLRNPSHVGRLVPTCKIGISP